MTPPFLLYGSYGYSGSLIADLAVSHGMHPILSGRDLIRLQSQSERLGFEYRHVVLDDTASIEVALKDAPLVLNCAGPYGQTFKPVVEACLRMGRHYVDLAYEILVLEALHTRDIEARQAGIMIMSGAGFDVVPSDCLAAHLKQRLPQATRLELAINALGRKNSRGTQLSVFEGTTTQSMVRKEGKLVYVPIMRKTRRIDFGNDAQTAVSLPWGDISTAFYSTGIPNIEFYLVVPKSDMRILNMMRLFPRLVQRPFFKRYIKEQVMKLPIGPSSEERRHSQMKLWGEASDDEGHHAVSRMLTPDPYNLTAETALRVVEKVLAGDYKAGFQTPSLAYGADFILEFEGVQREDL